MGAWSHDSFGNDDACDWSYELEETDNLELIESTLEAVLDAGNESVDSPEACRAIAAAETVARLQGRFGVRDSYTKTVDDWVAKVKLKPSAALAKKAQQVLDRVMTEPSELLELWFDDDGRDQWIGAIKELRGRISA